MITMGKHSYNITKDIDCYSGVNLTIGKFCSVGSGFKIISGEHPCVAYPSVVSQYPFREQHWNDNYPPSKGNGTVTIGNDVWIATDVTILEGVTVGDGAILGTKSVIGSDVPPYTIAIGNPWKPLRKRFRESVIAKLLLIKWWDWEDDKIKQSIPFMIDFELFVETYK